MHYFAVKFGHEAMQEQGKPKFLRNLPFVQNRQILPISYVEIGLVESVLLENGTKMDMPDAEGRDNDIIIKNIR